MSHRFSTVLLAALLLAACSGKPADPPAAAAAYTMLLGDADAALPILEEPADETPVQQAA